MCASVKDRSPRLAENNYAHPIARRATLTTRDNKGDEAEGDRGRESANIKGDFTVQIKIYHNRKGPHGEGEGERQEEEARRRRSALFTIFNMQSRHPSLPSGSAVVLLARARPGMNKH